MQCYMPEMQDQRAACRLEGISANNSLYDGAVRMSFNARHERRKNSKLKQDTSKLHSLAIQVRQELCYLARKLRSMLSSVYAILIFVDSSCRRRLYTSGRIAYIRRKFLSVLCQEAFDHS